MADVPEPTHLDLVAQHVRQGRLAMRLSIEDAAKSVGMSAVTWTRVEKGQPVRSLSYVGIERALHWRAGSIDKLVADGTAPGFEEPPHPRHTVDLAEHDPVERLVQEIYADEKIPEERKRELVRLIRKAEAQAEAERQAARDELNRWRRGA